MGVDDLDFDPFDDALVMTLEVGVDVLDSFNLKVVVIFLFLEELELLEFEAGAMMYLFY